jgi:hypothetical protein
MTLTRNELADAMSRPFDELPTDALYRLIMHCADVRQELRAVPLRSGALRAQDRGLRKVIKSAKQTLATREDAPELKDEEIEPVSRLIAQREQRR